MWAAALRPHQRPTAVAIIAAMDYSSCRDRYASAVCASDLSPRPRSVGPLDVLGAAGMAAQRHPLGMLLQRLRADVVPRDRALAVDLLAHRLRAAVRKREVRRDGVDAEVIAGQALDWWLDPTCLTCGGVKFKARDARLTGKHCPACAGTGRRRLESAAPAAAAWVVDTIGQQVAMSESAHRRVMR